MQSGFEALLGHLAQRDLILPYFETAVLADNWPDSYTITIDSSPYYGAGDGYFHPSTHALKGERELYYMMHPDHASHLLQERPSLQREMAFAMGSALHGVVQTQMQMCQLVRGPQDIEVEYVNTEHHVRGRIDWITHHPNGTIIPVEMKTRTHFKFHKQLEPEPSWVAQLNLGLDSQDIDLGVLLMVESGYPYRCREFQVPRDRKLLDEIYAKFDRVREAVATNTPPRYCCPPDSAVMKACPARNMCWLAEESA